jgi:hypothetical protein
VTGEPSSAPSHLADRLAAACDRDEIRQLLYRYARGVDRSDVDLLRSVYAPGGTDHHGLYDGPGRDYADRLVAAEAEATNVGNHHLTNMLIEIDGDTARAETYFLAVHPHEDDGEERLGVTSGRYLDSLVRVDGQWAILRREVVNDWTRLHWPGELWPRASWQAGGFLRGAKGRADPSYEFFEDYTARNPEEA